MVARRRTRTVKKAKIKSKVDLAKEARRRARDRAGLPPGLRVIPDKRRKPPKHKKRVFDEQIG